MAFDAEKPDETASPSLLYQVNAIGEVFLQAWTSLSPVSIEQLLSKHAQFPRRLLLYELLSREVLLIHNQGIRCSLRDYLSRFPDDQCVIKAVFENRNDCSDSQLISKVNPLATQPSPLPEPQSPRKTPLTKTVLEEGLDNESDFILAANIQLAPERSTEFIAPMFPGYQVFKVIGQGGMGIVYLGIDLDSKRWVALKTLRQDFLLNSNAVRRFHKEVNAYRKLNHPHIVKYLKDFEHQGHPVLVLEYACAGSLANILHRGITLPPRVAALMIEQLASAVAVAHQNQLLHRDITPSNILFDLPEACEIDLDETHRVVQEMDRDILQDRFDWRRIVPKLTDFGLLLSLEESEDTISKLTFFGQVMGTPSYMSPESVSPRFGKSSYQTDVYGLGACLYAAMTGKPPHIGFNIVDTMHRVVSDVVVPPRLIGRHIPHELSEICLRCLARDRHERFVSVDDLHHDLVQFRTGKRLKFARPPGLGTRGIQWCRRNPVTALSMLSILCFGLLVTFMLHSLNRRAVNLQNRANLEAIAREELGVIRESLLSQFDLVKAVGIYASEHEDFSEEQFQEFCGPLVRSHRSIKALSWAAFVPQEMRKNFEETTRFSDQSPPSIYERNASGERVPAHERRCYVPVQFIVPRETNQQAIGFDLGSEVRRLSALRRAEKQSDLAITSPLQLVQDEVPVEAFLAVFPVWHPSSSENAPGNTLASFIGPTIADEPDDSHRSLRGFASGVFHTEELIEPCLKIAGSRLWLRILDVTEGRTVVYTMPELQRLASNHAPLPLAYSASMENFGRNWEVEFYIPANSRPDSNSLGIAILVSGCFVSIISASVLPLLRRFLCVLQKHAAKYMPTPRS